ncbi:T9SS type A sorting domain-containing protein [bacterium]|nr:T9SS type A sorting domain-containing protein [bacterium]
MKKVTTHFNLIFLILYIGGSYSLTAQTKTVSLGGLGDDKIYDMVSHNGLNYILGDFPIGTDTIFNVADSAYALSCIRASIIVLDDSFNLKDYYCILDSANNAPSALFAGKLAIDSITNSLYLCGTSGSTVKFGNDIISNNNNNVVFPFFVRFDLQLNPIWARTSYCNYSWNYYDSEITSLTIDNEGKPWAFISIQGAAQDICYNNDTIHSFGKIYADSIGQVYVSKSLFYQSLIPLNLLFTSIAIDSNRIIETYNDNTLSVLQIIDSKVDTVVWKKPITNDLIRKTAVDLNNRFLYTLSDGGILRKYNMYDGSLVYQQTITTANSAKGIALTKDGSKVYVSGISTSNIHKIYALAAQTGSLIDSIIWGHNSFSNNFGTIGISSFLIENDKLKSVYTGSTRFVTFGTDSLNEYHNDEGIFSIIDLYSLLTTIGTHKEQRQSISVYPNPTTGILNINSTEPITGLRCFDIQGRVVPIVHLNGFSQISLPPNLNKGVYFLEINFKDKKEIVKIIR